MTLSDMSKPTLNCMEELYFKYRNSNRLLINTQGCWPLINIDEAKNNTVSLPPRDSLANKFEHSFNKICNSSLYFGQLTYQTSKQMIWNIAIMDNSGEKRPIPSSHPSIHLA